MKFIGCVFGSALRSPPCITGQRHNQLGLRKTERCNDCGVLYGLGPQQFQQIDLHAASAFWILYYSEPFEEGEAPSKRSSGVTACRKARARPLKQVSTM